MYSSILSGCLSGLEASLVHVEVDIGSGLPGFSMVGLLGDEVREAKERVQVALKNAKMDIPPNKITVNLSPANLRKEGSGFDVPIAVGVLQSLSYFPPEATEETFFVGELGLNGEIRPIRGVLPLVREAARQGVRSCIVPMENVAEGSIIPDVQVRGAENLRQLADYLAAGTEEERERILPLRQCLLTEMMRDGREQVYPDFADVRGQEGAKRAAEIAAAGFHNLLMSGPPGGGKSMIARRIGGILPPLNGEECLEVSAIYSVAGMLTAETPLITQRPFKNPHHTITGAALVGGGTGKVRPGAITLAHRGVLFLDELPEFRRSVLENLRQPLEEHRVTVSRSYGSYTYPAHFLLVCAMNPCRCGYYPDKNRCTCTESELNAYRGRLSGPLLDRIDMYVETARVELSSLKFSDKKEESSSRIRERVRQARQMQEERFAGRSYSFNSEMEPADMEVYCQLGATEQRLIEKAYTRLGLSARNYHRLLKVSRTIADLAGEEEIREEHIMEALSYRMSERSGMS